jgi:tetratricopeptide (TPR) repeat protein
MIPSPGFSGNLSLGVRPINPWGSRPTFTMNRPLYAYHQGWHHGFWPSGNRFPAVWVGGGFGPGWLLAPNENFLYTNPYCVQPATGPTAVFDYSQPLPSPPVPPVSVIGQPEPTTEAEQPPAEVVKGFEAARGAFKQGDYRKALEQVDKAIARLPGDAVLHEFRALVHFALGNYRDAAATIYPVLAAGPGWDWETMKSLYPDVKTYTEQLRALEAYQRSNPKSPEASFVLAYHYLVLEYPEAARKQLENVVALRPDDKLAAQLIQFLTQSRSDKPAPQP